MGLLAALVLLELAVGVTWFVIVHRPGRTSASAATTQPTAIVATPAPLTSLSAPIALPPPVATALPTTAAPPTTPALPTALPAAPPALPTAIPTHAPTSVPTAADDWQRLQPVLDRAWGNDTRASVQLLDGFLVDHPGFDLAHEKLYAALLAQAAALFDDGAPEAAVESLQRAATLVPSRLEAPAQLRALTPTPVIAPPPPAPAQSTTARIEVPPARVTTPPKPVVRPVAPPARSPAQPPPPATPTKAPFRPPAR